MKKFIALIFMICLCATLALSFSSCEHEEEQEKSSATEETELRELADPALINQIKEGMTREQVNDLLETEPIVIDSWSVYKFTDGQIANVYYKRADTAKEMYVVSGSILLDKLVNPARIEDIKGGMTYDRATEILGAEGMKTTSRYWGVYRYVLNDGRLLYIDYDEQAFVTEVYIIEENGEATYIIGTPPKEPIIFEDLDSFKQYLLTTYKGKETTIPVPKLVSNEYKHLKAQDTDKYFFYSFRPIRHVSTPTTHYAPEHFYVTVYKEDDSYQKLVDEDKATEFDGYAFTESKKEYSSQFFFNNNGRCVRISVPTDFNLKGKIIDTLEELNKYIVIEYLDISENSNLN